MGTKVFRGIAVFLLILLLVPTAQGQRSILQEISERGKIIIAINTGVRPFTFRDDKGDPAGFCVDLNRLIGEKMGVEVEFVDLDWAGLLPALLAGRVDMIGDRMSNTLERAKSVAFTDPYFRTGTIAYTRTNTPFTSWQDLNDPKITVGAALGAIGEVLAEEKLPLAQKAVFNSTAEMTEALMAGRIDAALEDDVLAVSESAKAPDKMRVLEGYLYVDTYAFTVRHENPELLRWLNLFFEQIKRSGEFEAIYEKWIGPWNPIPQKLL